MILIEDALGFRNVALELGLLAPGQPEQHIEIIAHDRGLGRHRRHRLELLEFRRRLGPCFLAELELGDLGGQFGNFVAALLGIAVPKFTLDRLQLLVEIIFALGLLHLALDPAADLFLDLKHTQFTFHEGERHFEPTRGIEFDQQRLLVSDLDADVGGNRIGKP